MRSRTWIALLLISTLAAGCGSKEPTTAGGEAKPPAKKEEPITLTFWHIMNYPGPKEVLDDAVKRFMRANRNVEVKVQTFENDAYKTKLNIEMASGTPPDIFHTWGGGALGAAAKAGRVRNLSYDLSRGGWHERFLENPLLFCTYEGRVFAVPLDLSCVPVWYNGELFDRHRLTPPKTFDELLALCKTLRDKDITPFALGNRKVWPGAFFFVYLACRTGGTQPYNDALERKPGAFFNDVSFIRAGELLQKLVQAKAFSTGFNAIEDDEARTQFLNGQAAMYLTGTWLVPRVKEENPDFLDKLKCFPFPTVPGGFGDPSTVVGGVNCAFAVSSSCAHPEEAIELLRFLTDEETAAEWCRVGRIPAVNVPAKFLKKLPPPTRAAFDLLQNAKSVQPYYDQSLPPRLQEEHKRTTQALFGGHMTPGQAADYMENAARGF